MITILVADDHDLVRTGIARMLSDVADFSVVAEVSSGEDAVKQCRKSAPDVVFMDLRMPGIGGLEATRKILTYKPDINIIALTGFIAEPMPSRLIQAGARGFLSKGASVAEMESAVRKVVNGQRYLSPEVAEDIALKSFEEANANPFTVLSDREMQIALMIVNCEKPQDIAETLFISAKTVNSYRYRIFEKLNISGDVELALLAVRHSLLDGLDGSLRSTGND